MPEDFICVNTKTKEEYIFALKKMFAEGYVWLDRSKNFYEAYWESRRENQLLIFWKERKEIQSGDLRDSDRDFKNALITFDQFKKGKTRFETILLEDGTKLITGYN